MLTKAWHTLSATEPTSLLNYTYAENYLCKPHWDYEKLRYGVAWRRPDLPLSE